jgi:glycosyltransferase involved in cell wall biosynthesis
MFLTLNGVPQERIRIVPHGIEPLGKFPAKSLDGRQIRFGYMGTFGPPKGFHVLIRALQMVSPQNACQLHVYGEARNPWDKAYLDATMNSYHGTSAVILHGRIDHDKLREAYQTIDVLIVPSIYLEVFGLVILEALSAGRPVIVSKSGGPEELVSDGVDGFVVERNNSQAMADAMQRFIDNPNLIVKMSNRISPVKTIQQYVDEIEKIYHHLASK